MIWQWLVGVGSVLLAPVLAVITALHPRTRAHWSQRWAWRFPAVAPGAIWIHASSVGEGQAAAALCEALRHTESRPVLLRTASTDTGLATARGHHVLAARPVDTPWVVARWLDRVRPRLLVLVEGDLWPNLLWGCRRRSIPVVVVGVRSGRGTSRLRRLAPGLFRDMAACISLWLVTEEGMGLPGTVAQVEQLKGLPADLDPVPLPEGALVAGSTRSGDEQALLTAWRSLSPRPLLVLAPRHPARFEAVAGLLAAGGEPWHRWSLSPALPAGCEVLLVDTVGDLARFYPGASAAFVGGTFSKDLGGHSPAEAAAAGLSLVRGPHHHANRAAWEGLDVQVAATPSDLSVALQAALERGRGAPVVGNGVAQTVVHLMPFLSAPVPAERPLRPWLGPLGLVWRALVAARELGWRWRKPIRVPAPVISVGGLGSGGAGKTPVVRELMQQLGRRGRRPAVVARGYGRVGAGEVRTPATDPSARGLGDELAMLASEGLVVVSAPNRVAGALRALQEGADVVVLDDGFQHRRLHRDLDVVVVDPRWPGEGGPLPVGEAREGMDALSRAHCLWLSGPGIFARGPVALPQVRSCLVPRGWHRGGELMPLDSLPAGPVTAIAAIARPGRFLAQLVGLGLDVRRWRVWPDHHPWTQADEEAIVAMAAGTTLVCTAKDRVRFSAEFPGYALCAELELSSGQEVLARLLDEVLA